MDVSRPAVSQHLKVLKVAGLIVVRAEGTRRLEHRILTPIESPIRDFLRAQPACVADAERMRTRFFPELVPVPAASWTASTEASPKLPQRKGKK
jgi:DNA-binding FadR family transcriptional regulator